MTNEPNPNSTNETNEFENFERLAKKLINLKPIDISKIEEEEKAMGIAPDESDFEKESEEEESNSLYLSKNLITVELSLRGATLEANELSKKLREILPENNDIESVTPTGNGNIAEVTWNTNKLSIVGVPKLSVISAGLLELAGYQGGRLITIKKPPVII